MPKSWTNRILISFIKPVVHSKRIFNRPKLTIIRFSLYATVAGHEAVCTLISYVASRDLHLEDCNITNAYLYENLYTSIIAIQPTNSSGGQAASGHHCVFLKSLYGARQAGRIWEYMLDLPLLSWRFTLSVVVQRLRFIRTDSSLIILSVVVDDIAFASNNMKMVINLKYNLEAKFVVKLYDNIKSVILRTITRTTATIYVSPADYARRLLSKLGFLNCNSVKLPLPLQVNLKPCRSTETPLGPHDDHIFWSVMGFLAYLSIFTRPDFTLAVSALTRSVHAPPARHLALWKRVFCCLAGTLQYELCFAICRSIVA